MNTACPPDDGWRARAADGPLAPEGSEALRRHLTSCPQCAAEVAVQVQVRHLLRERAAELVGRAPDTLRHRLAQQAARGQVVELRPRQTAAAMRPARRGWTAWVPRSAAAGLLLAIAGLAALGAFTPRGTLLAAELALDHLKCLIVAPGSEKASAEALEQRWATERGWAVSIPESSPDHGLTLVGLRNCLSHHGQMAHVMYDLDGRRVSLFVVRGRSDAGVDRRLFGQRTVTWMRGDRTYAMVTDADGQRVAAVAAYLQATAH